MSEIPVASPVGLKTISLKTISPSLRATRLIAVILLALFAILLFASVRQESQTMDEADHIFAGFEYWKHADFGRNPEHPPLVKLLAAAPLLSMGLKEPPAGPTTYFKLQDFVNAPQFLYSSDADAILLRGRCAVSLFSLLLAVLVFFATQEMFNPLTGILALGLFIFEPALLANGPLITTDMALTCFFFASVYFFYRYVKKPSLPRLLLCAAAAGLAVVSKHSGFLLFPSLILLAFVEFFAAPRYNLSATSSEPRSGRRLFQLASALVVIALVCYLFVWTIYGFRYAARPGQLQLIPSLSSYAADLTPVKQSVITFLARHHLLPEAYLYGWIDILLISGARPIFIWGHNFSSGQWFFFPAVFLIKTTLSLLIFLLLLPFARIRQHRREFLFLTIPPIFFLSTAIFSMLNLGLRHILPIYPFCIVLGAAAAAAFVNRSLVARIAVTALLLLTTISSLRAFPDFLAYSNELTGGPSHTYRYVSDANADWGQGFKWTKIYLDQHPTSECWFAPYTPVVDPAYYGISCKPLLSSFGHMIGFGSATASPTITGTVLISGTELAGNWWGPDDLNPYRTFRDRKPDAMIGNIILVYNGTFDVPLLAAQSNAYAANQMLRQHRFPEALALAQTAVQQAPNSAEVNAVLGQALLASGRTEEGRQSIATALHLAQTIHPDYQKRLATRLQRLVQPSQN